MNRNAKSSNSSNSKSYNTILNFSKFLRQNGDKLFEKNSKLSLKADQIIILQEYLSEIVSSFHVKSTGNAETKVARKDSNVFNAKDFIQLYKSNHLPLIQDFLYKVTNLKVTSTMPHVTERDYINLNIFGSITYLEIKNWPVNNISSIQYLRNQLEVLICNKSVDKIHDLLYSCGKDLCNSPISWPKLNTLNLSYNRLKSLDDNFRLTTSIEILDLSHNNLRDCGTFLHSLIKLKKLNLSFNNLESIPSLYEKNGFSSIEYMDLSYNNIEDIHVAKIQKLEKLKHLNLNSNLIDSINKLNTLNVLTNIEFISIKQNPISNNKVSDSILQEIIEQVKYNKSKKKTEFTFTRQSISKQLKKTPQITINQSENDQSTFKRNGSLTSTALKRRLKVNNILISNEEENVNKFEKDYVLINSVTLEDSLIKSLPKETLSSSFLNNDYESSNLQLEIEKLKQMRLNYGDDWLLSTPNLQLENNIPETTEETTKALDQNNQSQIESSDKQDISDIVDSFVVCRTAVKLGDSTETTEPCIISLSENSLIEKDEMNIEMISLNYLSNIIEIQIVNDENKKLLFSYKGNECPVTYQFENNQEFDLFIEALKKVLFNKTNLQNCELVYCLWCADFIKKSKFKVIIDNQSELDMSLSSQKTEESKDNEYETLTCTKCDRYLIKNQIVQNNTKDTSPPDIVIDSEAVSKVNGMKKSPTFAGFSQESKSSVNLEVNQLHKTTSSVSLGTNFTLKDALESFKEVEDVESSIEANLNSTTEQITAEIALPPEPEIETAESPSTSDSIKLESLLNKNQLTKDKLDERTKEHKKINNNLKLYLIVNILKNNESANGELSSGEDTSFTVHTEEDEIPVAIFRMKYFFFKKRLSEEEIKMNKTPLRRIDNCLILLTNKNIIVFKLLDQELFDQNASYDKCLKRKFTLDVTQIETIEIGAGQNYLVLEKQNNEVRSRISNYKFVTLDMYESQAFLNILLKIINESKSITMLKNIKKKNVTTNKNLQNVVNTIERTTLESPPELLPINIYTLVENLTINESVKTEKKFEFGIQTLFLYNNEHIIFLEENLNYDEESSIEQFHVIDNAKISDIVHLKLFPDCDLIPRLEISLIDESRNSMEVTWFFQVSEPHILSQFIAHVKDTWEQIFSIEMPINY